MQGTVLSLELLLIGSQAAERWRDQSDDEAGEAVPSEGGDWSLPANQLGQLLTEEGHVEDWLGGVDVE